MQDQGRIAVIVSDLLSCVATGRSPLVLADRKVYYHVTTPSHAKLILKNGLKADREGQIYLLNYDVLRSVINVASSQIFSRRVTVLEVCAKGVKGRVESDNVAEAYAKYQVRVKQPRIGAEHITMVCSLNVSTGYDSTAVVFPGSNAQLRTMKVNAFASAKAKGLPLPKMRH